jgi:hypothetical protein
MVNSPSALEALSSSDLLARTRELVRNSQCIEAELLVHLGEIDERKLYLECAFPSMFAFCVGELGFSEDVAYNRIAVARAGRRLPVLIEAVRGGRVHLAGLRLLVPHITAENHGEVLAQAAGKSKREIEELIARFSPQAPVPAVIRKLPERVACAPALPAAPAWVPVPAPAPCAQSTRLTRGDEPRPIIAPLSEETFKIQFTASRMFRDKLRKAQDLLRHRVPDGNLGTILGKALDLLIEEVTKERFASGRTPRQTSSEDAGRPSSRHIPDAIKRAVFERDGGRCTFADHGGRRCSETGALEFDHMDGFARTHLHQIDRIRLLCRAHNQHAAEQMYGRACMERARAAREAPSTRPGPSSEVRLL